MKRIRNVSLGAGAGIVFGAAFGNPAVGLVLGAALGLLGERLRRGPRES